LYNEVDGWNKRYFRKIFGDIYPFSLNREKIYLFQKLLIKNILKTEKKVKQFKSEYKQERRILLNELTQCQKGSKKRWEFNKRLDKIDLKFKTLIERYDERLFLLRLCGDTIVWNMLDRIWIRNAYQHTAKNYLYLNSGLDAELEAFHSVYYSSDTAIPIFNDLTNLLHFGDITIVEPGRPNKVIEVKSSTSENGFIITNRIKKQLDKLIRFSSYLKNKYEIINIENLSDEHQITREIIEIECEDKNNWILFNKLLENVSEDPFSYEIVDNCLIYLAVNLRKTTISKVLPNIISKIPFGPQPTYIGCITRSYEEFHIYQPITTFDIDLNSIYEVIFYEKTFFCVILINELISILEKRGWKCEINHKKGIFSIYKDKSNPIQLLFYQFNRIVYEFITIETFINYLNAIERQLSNQDSKDNIIRN